MWPRQIYAAVINKRGKPVILLFFSYVCNKIAQNIALDSQVSVGSIEVAEISCDKIVNLVQSGVVQTAYQNIIRLTIYFQKSN
jgi:hypothetical protein